MTILMYLFLYLTIIALWIPQFKKVPLWSICLITSILLGLISQRIDYIALAFIVLLAIVTWYLGNSKKSIAMRVLSAVILFALGVGLGMFLLPGFHNQQVLKAVYIRSDAIPFNLYLNFDKTILGVFIVGFLHQRVATKHEWIRMAKIMAPRGLLVVFVVACLSFLLNYVRFDPQLSPYFLLWAATNLLFVCFAEEAFFSWFYSKIFRGDFTKY